ncbi:adenine deaminase, partial [Methanocorpusculaceae archaeon]|nr:adenine deaminase [Methanocorpusculaceae archaeon]
YEEVCAEMETLHTALEKTGANEKAFMSLSFMALTVVPHLKITPRGLFDGDTFTDVDIRC